MPNSLLSGKTQRRIRMKKMMKAMISVCILTSGIQAQDTNNIEQSLSLYGWLPTLNGTLRFNIPGEPDESADSNVIDSLDSVFMGSYEAKNEQWSFLADAIYLKLSGSTEGSVLGTTLDLELTSKLYSFYGGYNLINKGQYRLDAITGMRYFSLGLDETLHTQNRGNISASQSLDYFDALIGVKGSYAINSNWYVPYLLDIGAGDSDLTWQASASLAYRFGWGDAILTYRYMHYDKKNTPLIEDLDLYGPKLGVVFHF